MRVWGVCGWGPAWGGLSEVTRHRHAALKHLESTPAASRPTAQVPVFDDIFRFTRFCTRHFTTRCFFLNAWVHGAGPVVYPWSAVEARLLCMQ